MIPRRRLHPCGGRSSRWQAVADFPAHAHTVDIYVVVAYAMHLGEWNLFIIGLEIGCRGSGSRYVCKISNFRFLQ